MIILFILTNCKYVWLEAPPINTQYIEQITTASTPYKAKILSNQTISHRYAWNVELNQIINVYKSHGTTQRADWKQVKDVIILKFRTDQHCQEVLKSTGTGTTKLREVSPYDRYWGWIGAMKKEIINLGFF